MMIYHDLPIQQLIFHRGSPSKVTSDMEWALTNGLDFTVLNDGTTAKATEEVLKASRYCFEDPF
jgi:hypothetical protein